MADLEGRLIGCFATAFPGVARQQIPAVSMGSLASWDSLAGITLFALIEEEFKIGMSPDDAAGLVSFELILNYLQKESPRLSAEAAQ